MNEEYKRRAIEAALNRRVGRGDFSQLHDFNNSVSDWYVACPHCGARLRGTLDQIKEHSCGSTSKQ